MRPDNITLHRYWLILISIVLLSGCSQQRHPIRLLIPVGYIGPVQIEYGVTGAPVLPLEDGHRVLKILPSGYLRTSTDFEEGGASTDDYYYVNGQNRTPLVYNQNGLPNGPGVWGGSVGGDMVNDKTSHITQEFYVGYSTINQQNHGHHH